MLNKTWLCIISVILSVIFVCGCASKPTDTGATQTQETTTVADPSTDISVPEGMGVADSIFNDEAITPTATDNETPTTKEEDETTQGASDTTTEPAVEATTPNVAPEKMTYEAFTALTPAEQRLYQESFPNLDAFFEWYSAAKEKYEKENPPIDIDGPIDLGKI